MPHWFQLMAESLPSLLCAGLIFTIPLTLLSCAFGLTLGLATAIGR
ncbi:cysteine ABC transporter permease, partial [Rhizobium leguminosarum]